MNKVLQFFLPIFLLIISGCKKDPSKNQPQQPLNPSYKMVILQGNGQSDTANHTLKDTIIIKVTNNGSPYSKGTIRFITTGCDSNITQTTGGYEGNYKYSWQLNGVIGTENLKAVLLDSTQKIVDSIIVTAKAVMPLHGWQPVGCLLPSSGSVATIAKLSTGRLLAGFYANTYLYYSDDNALTWHPLKSLGNTHSVRKIVTLATDEIFILTYTEGIFYSHDAGNTWVQRNGNSSLNISYPLDLVYTKSGKLFFDGDNGLYVSTDKGLSYNLSSGGIYDDINVSEQPSGTDYTISDYKLFGNAGGSWAEVNSAYDFSYSYNSLFIDINGDIYSGVESNTAQLLRSKDNGNNWTTVYNEVEPNGLEYPINQIQTHGNIYTFYITNRGLAQTTDFTTFTYINNPFLNGPTGYDWSTYLFANNNALVVGGNALNSIYYYLP